MNDKPVGIRRWNKLVDQVKPVELRTDVPHSARMYDYFLGGKDNFPADREAAEQFLKIFPETRVVARQNRAFLQRAVRFLTAEAGIRQFLDIGTGIPTSPNLHEVAQSVAPECRVVYVDNDPIVLAHARALLTGTPEGRTAYLDADLRDPAKILESAELRDTLDLSRPVAFSLIAILHFLQDSEDPYGIVRTYLDALPSGSYLVITHGSAPVVSEETEKGADVYNKRGINIRPRTPAEIERFFDGLEFVEPGLRPIHQWRPEGTAEEKELAGARLGVYGGVARLP